MAEHKEAPPRVGTVRPSQLTFSHGVGALVDLPGFSVLVGGLDLWRDEQYGVVFEDRLLTAVTAMDGLGNVEELRSAPWMEEEPNPFEEWARVGVPVLVFPRWLRCSACNMLATVDSGLYELKRNPFRPDLARYVHGGCAHKRGRAPLAVPARLVSACAAGHLDEFPWVEFCHGESGACTGKARLRFFDVGSGTRSTEAFVECLQCGARRFLTKAFGEPARSSMPGCRGRHPHLLRFDPVCPEQVRAMLLGASNAWFPVTARLLSIPPSPDRYDQLTEENWDVLREVESRADIDSACKFNTVLAKRLGNADRDRLWAAIERRRSRMVDTEEALDLHRPEWETFTDPAKASALASPDFLATEVAVPAAYTDRIERVVLAERLREVVALCGFTRVDGPDSGVAADADSTPSRVVPLGRHPIRWLPATEVRGEGIFLQFPEAAVEAWVDRVAGHPRVEALRASLQRWRSHRGLDPSVGWPGERFLLLHSLAHTLMNQIALECGYAAASIRERIYCEEPGGRKPPMAGILLYTSAPDSEGTLGGLVALGRPQRLGPIITEALDRCRLCSSDPHCAEHCPTDTEEALHLGACHACLFVPETSCDSGNRFLDRALLVDTIEGAGLEYFG